MGTFEGYVGIRLWDGQLVDDVVFSLLFVLFMCFALVFRTNYRLFLKMMRDAVSYTHLPIFCLNFCILICWFHTAKGKGLFNGLDRMVCDK